jgi:hypothetical protein
MKYTFATLAALALVMLATSMAFGRDISGTLSSWDTSPTGIYHDSRVLCGSPFPMAADPALVNGRDRDILPEEELPASMAANLSSWDTSPTAVYHDNRVLTGSPFPQSGDPALTSGRSSDRDRKLDDVDAAWHSDHYTGNEQFPDAASPFPQQGNPARRFW